MAKRMLRKIVPYEEQVPRDDAMIEHEDIDRLFDPEYPWGGYAY